MIREAEHAETKNDFKYKMGIAQKEINETIYWLELLKETDYLIQVHYSFGRYYKLMNKFCEVHRFSLP